MCGIIGYIGKEPEKNLIEGLEKLEYRGYDSAGLCVQRDGDFYVEKTIGSVDKLSKKTKRKESFGVGIAHTRWATHGAISVFNAHPHFSSNANVSLVHNGIIENFETLKNGLEKQGVYFYGETDSEVVCKLFRGKLNLKTFKQILDRLEGSYAFAVISKQDKSIYFAKNKSPLYVSLGDDCSMVSSDPSCFIGKSDEFFSLADGEYGKLSLGDVKFYNKKNERVSKQSQKIDFIYKNENKNQYRHYMIKEINESKTAIENIAKKYCDKALIEIFEKIKRNDFNRVYLIGCGTAYHAGLVGKYYFSQMKKYDVFCEIASEIQNQNYIIDKKSLAIFISQSGETSDTISALEYMKGKGAITLSITNVEYSTIATKSDFNLPICAGQEKAVASTKAYIGQIAVLFVLTQYLKGEKYIECLQTLADNLDYGDDKVVKRYAKILSSKDKLFILGRGIDYVTGLEGALKIKEISYINCSCIQSGELKHGPLALIDRGTYVICVASDEKIFAKALNNACETKSRGAKLILITCLDCDEKIKKNFKYIYKVDCKNTIINIEQKTIENDLLKPIQMIIFFQKLAYFISEEKNINPDKPRNLAKSVTVE